MPELNTIASLLIVAVTFAVNLGISFDGSCGGFFPGLWARQPCSAREYATRDLVAIAVLLDVSYWPAEPAAVPGAFDKPARIARYQLISP